MRTFSIIGPLAIVLAVGSTGTSFAQSSDASQPTMMTCSELTALSEEDADLFLRGYVQGHRAAQPGGMTGEAAAAVEGQTTVIDGVENVTSEGSTMVVGESLDPNSLLDACRADSASSIDQIASSMAPRNSGSAPEAGNDDAAESDADRANNEGAGEGGNASGGGNTSTIGNTTSGTPATTGNTTSGTPATTK